MKLHLVLVLASIALAWADVSHLGYNYNTPSGSYLPGDHSSSSSSGGVQIIPSVIVQQPSGSYLPAGGDGHFGSSSGYHSSQSFGVHGGGHGAEETEVHYYGDDTHEQSRLRIHVAPAPSRNRVIFVKSPDTGSSIIPEIIAPAGQSQERTVVYVLSKKQDGIGAITIPSSVTHNVVRSKPEVFYLKYKDGHDAERVVAESLQGGRAGIGVSSINDKDSFVRTLGSGAHGGISGVLGSLGGGHGGSGGIGFSSGGSFSGGSGGGGFGSSGLTGIHVGGGGGGGVLIGSGSSGSRYGVPGASGPY